MLCVSGAIIEKETSMYNYNELLHEIDSNLYLQILLFFVCAFVTSLFLIPKIRAIFFKLNIQDLPNDRSSHSVPVPTFGGASFCIGVVNFSMTLIMFYVITNFRMVASVFILISIFVANITLLFLRSKSKSAVRLKKIIKKGDVNDIFLLDGQFHYL